MYDNLFYGCFYPFLSLSPLYVRDIKYMCDVFGDASYIYTVCKSFFPCLPYTSEFFLIAELHIPKYNAFYRVWPYTGVAPLAEVLEHES